MNVDLTDVNEESNELRLSASLKKQRWALLATGFGGAAVIILFLWGAIPGVANKEGTVGFVGVALGGAFVAAAGVVSWWLWTRLANFRTRWVSLTDQGILVEFLIGSTARLNWADPNLRITIQEFSSSSAIPGATLRWGTGGIGRYAHLSHAGAERVKSEAIHAGLHVNSTTAGKPPNLWYTTQISRS